MSTEETPTESTATESKFQPIVFTNEPDDEADAKLSQGRRNLKKWLGRKVRVTLKNKLSVVGIFSCTDHDQNLVIANCETYLPDDVPAVFLGNAMLAGNEIAAFEVFEGEENQEDEEQLERKD